MALTAATLPPDLRDWYRARLRLSTTVSAQPPAQFDPLAEAIVQWDALRQSDSLAFQSYASFLRQHPGWPGESAMRRAAERGLKPDNVSPTTIVDHFQRFPPLTNIGALRLAEALLATGRKPEAVFQARTAWVGGAMPLEEENRLLARFGAELSLADHDSRMERLLWDDSLSAAQRQMNLTSLPQRDYFQTRLALKLKSPDAAARLDAIAPRYPSEPGLIADKARWQRDTGDWVGARRTLADATVAPGAVRYSVPWMKLHLDFARAAANDKQWGLAYAIAAETNPYPAGTILRSRSDVERDLLTSLE